MFHVKQTKTIKNYEKKHGATKNAKTQNVKQVKNERKNT